MMQYLFFDLEYATSKGGNIKICEFGFVITDENFNILKRDNFIINPNIIKEDWDFNVVKNILTRKIFEYEESPTFDEYYYEISNLIESSDYIFGHILNSDANALNCDCLRYELPSIDFKFYDIKEFYKQYRAIKEDVSVSNILKDLQIEGENGIHDAEVDSINTMYEFKAMLDNLDMTVDELIELCPSAVDYNENYNVKSLEIISVVYENIMKKLIDGTDDNIMQMYDDKYRLFSQFIDNVTPNDKHLKTLKNLKFAISFNYEETHFRQMLNIVQILCNKGAKYVKKETNCDIFVRYDLLNEDGSLKECEKLQNIYLEIDKGLKYKIISFNDFCKMIDFSEEELDSLPMVSFDCLYKEDAIIKDSKMRKYIEKQKQKEEVLFASGEESTTLGDLFGDLFKEFKK